MSDQCGFFDLDERYAALSKAGDPLERLSGVIDFEIFRPDLAAALRRSEGSRGGRMPMDPMLMVKVLVIQVLVIQALCRLSDAQAELQILDRRRFGRSPGLDDGDRAADETTIWRFCETLVQAKVQAKVVDRVGGAPWWTASLPGSMRTSRRPDTSRWAGRSWTLPLSRPRVSG